MVDGGVDNKMRDGRYAVQSCTVLETSEMVEALVMLMGRLHS